MLVRIVIEAEISGVDTENMQAEIETATLTWETPIIKDVRLVDWQETA